MKKRSSILPYEDMKRIDETETCFADFKFEEQKNNER